MGRLLLFLVLCAGLFHGHPASALNPERSIAQYKHTRWTTEDGAPASIRALAQGKGGYLWMGTRDGLVRFDGISFESVPPDHPAGDRLAVSALLAASDGSIWAGYEVGGVARYSSGALRDTAMPKPTAFVMKMLETKEGAIWAMVARGDSPLVRYSDGAWEEVGANWGLPSEYPNDLLLARDGTLWLTTRHSLLFLSRGSRRFHRAQETPTGYSGLRQDSAGCVWLFDDSGTRIVAPVAGQISYPISPVPSYADAFFDRDGNMWGAGGKAGIFRVRPPLREQAPQTMAARVDFFGERDTLTSDHVYSMLEDREGDIWVATAAGLDRFRAANVVAEPLLARIPQFGEVLLGASDGAVYIGGADGAYRIPPGGHPERVVDGAGEAEAMCEAPDGAIWMVMHSRIIQVSQSRFTNYAKPTTAGPITDCAVDRNGVVWLSADEGLFRSLFKGWQLFPIPDDDDDNGARPIIRCRDGSLLTFLSAEVLRRVEFPRQSDIVLSRQRVLGQFRTIYEGADSILIGGNFGLARWQDKRLSVIGPARVPAFARLTGVVQTPSGETWLMGSRGIVHVSTTALNDAFNDPSSPLQPTVLDFRDGLHAMNHKDGQRDAVRGGDGRMWFATLAGAVWVDPAHMAYNTLPPPVAISAFKADGVTYRDPAAITLPTGTSTGEIDFAALSLTIPERVSVRYRLEGTDQDWIDPGMRRQAFYTNLGPGTYRFHVIAANNDGVWNRQGATLAFVIPPTFFQSTGFYTLCAAGSCGLLWLAYSARTRQLTARVRSRLETQLAERERIARELHDTLLQGFQGLVLRFQAAANRIPPGEPIRAIIDQSLDRAEAVLVEGRNRVSELRSARENADLPQALTAIAADLAVDRPTRFTLTVEGRVRDLDPLVRVEILRIGEEAVGNAFRHANASAIEAVLIYARRDLRLGIRDDGDGMPEDIVAAGKRAGHFGLIGMRERAERAGGVLSITSRQDTGTEVRVIVPGRLAYLVRPRWRLGRRKTAPLPTKD